MTGQEFKKVRIRLNLTQQVLAGRIGVARNTVNRWEHELRRIPEPVVRLLHHIEKEVREDKKHQTLSRAERKAGE